MSCPRQITSATATDGLLLAFVLDHNTREEGLGLAGLVAVLLVGLLVVLATRDSEGGVRADSPLLGRLVPGKGLRRLLHHWRDVDVPLTLAGDGPLAGELAGLARDRPGVRLVGPLLGAQRAEWLAR